MCFRAEDGYKSVKPYLDKHLVIKKLVFQHCFTVVDETWEANNEKNETVMINKPVSHCWNTRSFVKFIREDRNIDGSLTKIGLDKGKGSLKFALSLFSPNTPDQTQDYLLAVAHGVEETYYNVMKMLDLCEIDLLDWDYFCSDLKMTMIVLGKLTLFLITCIKLINSC